MSARACMQVIILGFLPKMRGYRSLSMIKFLNSLILLQYLPRVYPIYRWCKSFNKKTRDQTTQIIVPDEHILPWLNYDWAPILVNFFLYIIASYVRVLISILVITSIYFNCSVNCFVSGVTRIFVRLIIDLIICNWLGARDVLVFLLYPKRDGLLGICLSKGKWVWVQYSLRRQCIQKYYTSKGFMPYKSTKCNSVRFWYIYLCSTVRHARINKFFTKVLTVFFIWPKKSKVCTLHPLVWKWSELWTLALIN